MTTKQRERDLLKWAALIAALVVTMQGEYALAVSAGFNRYVAVGVPAALDIYAVRALRAHRDIAAVVFAMIAVNSLSHLVAAHLLPVSVALVIAVSAIAPLVVWRVHALADADRKTQEAESGVESANRPVGVPNPVKVQAPAPVHANLPAEIPNRPANPAGNQVLNLPEPAANLAPNPAPEPTANQVHASAEPAPNPTPEPAQPKSVNLARTEPKPTKPKTTPKRPAPSTPTNPGIPPVLDQVQQILDLIDEHGYDTVKLGFVMEQTGMKKTAAYNTLVEARGTWQERQDKQAEGDRDS